MRLLNEGDLCHCGVFHVENMRCIFKHTLINANISRNKNFGFVDTYNSVLFNTRNGFFLPNMFF